MIELDSTTYALIPYFTKHKVYRFSSAIIIEWTKFKSLFPNVTFENFEQINDQDSSTTILSVKGDLFNDLVEEMSDQIFRQKYNMSQIWHNEIDDTSD